MRSATRTFLVGCAVGAALIGTARTPLAAQAAPGLRDIDRLREYRFGPDRAMLDAAAQVVKDSLGSASRRAEVADALAWVATSGAAFDARQFACRQLVYVASPNQIGAMVRLLDDELMAHYALYVLDRIPGPEVGEALRSAVPKLYGKALAGALDLLGERGEAASVPVLESALTSHDPATARAAAVALGRLGRSSADTVLLREHTRTLGELRRAIGHALVERAASLVEAGKRAEAARIAAAVLGAPESSGGRGSRRAEGPEGGQGVEAPVRAAALRVLALARGASAVPDLLAAVRSPEREIAHMAAAAMREIPGAEATRRLAQGLPDAPSNARALIADALGDRGDAAAEPALVRLLADTDSGVRDRAMAALGKVGGAASVVPLLRLGSSSEPSERAQAASALARLRGDGVSRAILAAMDDSDSAIRAGSLAALLERGAEIPKDRILRMATTETGPARVAALSALRQIGDGGNLDALIELLLKAPEADRDALSETVVAIARRDSAGAPKVMRALQQASNPADRISLLGCAGQIGGAEARTALIAAAQDNDPEVQITALRALSEWPTVEPMDTLVKIVRDPPSPRARAVALRGYLTMLRLPGGAPLAAAPGLYREALELARSDDEKRLALSGLSSVGSREALAMTRSLADSSDLRAEAELAMLSISHMTAGAWPAETRDTLGHLSANAQDGDVRRKAAALLATMDRFGDFAMAWEVSPSYEREATNFTALFDVAFPPETGASANEVGWRVMPVGTAPEQPWLLDLLALYGGEQKVAYLRTAVWSEAERDLVVEIGTDDGPKVWWNGRQVFANNTQRAVAPAQEKVTVRAVAGWNVMLLKVTQNVMGWGACVRFADGDGKPAAGLRVALPSFAEGLKP